MSGGDAPSGCWLIDLDGVVWLGEDPIPGSAVAIEELRRGGRRVGFVTNNSFLTRGDLISRLRSHGVVSVDEDAILSSAMAAAALVEPGSTAVVVGGNGIVEALVDRGVTVLEKDAEGDATRVDAVVVGLDWHLTYERLAGAVSAVLSGARLIGTNEDPQYPTKDGPRPGGGAVLAAVSYASGVEATIAGKPHQPMVDAIRHKFGELALVVGDRPATDGRLADALGVPFALVRSGLTAPDGELEHRPTYDAQDLAEIVALLAR